MRIIPAIDIIDGKCVRLTQGDFGKKKIYREDPVEVALEFQDADLDCLHLVDLDGAREGHVVNWDVIRDIQEQTALSVDFGGGVKTEEEVEQLLELGVHQINVGSLAVKEPEKFSNWLKQYGTENFILSADVKGETVAINGWLEDTSFRLFDLVSRFEREGLEYLACTDITTDGMLEGPNIGLYKKLIKRFPTLKVVASGGVSSMDDLKELKYAKVYAVIIGKAIYEGKLKLEELKAFQNT
ncbi:MAG: 1-(5-phosphoribosyl)-5-[(5-phosphoribosylamino)methylideneamino]imidazole-4-carboxamide isomerase [Cyclobacteriaceae bacterium]|nr:1-(5-phosphoribosyl)-5-[(5-phosphoribosylamino)methylideneamino]imidazole-4-carboxamide isomerase [Cyclobacteriaceae bacterium]